MSDVDTPTPDFDSDEMLEGVADDDPANADAGCDQPCETPCDNAEPVMARHNISILEETLDRMKAEADRRMTSPHMLFQKAAEMFLEEYEGREIF